MSAIVAMPLRWDLLQDGKPHANTTAAIGPRVMAFERLIRASEGVVHNHSYPNRARRGVRRLVRGPLAMMATLIPPPAPWRCDARAPAA